LAGNVNIFCWTLLDKRSVEDLQSKDDKLHTKQAKIRELKKGGYLGEISYLFDTTTTASAQTNNYTTMGVLEKEKADELFHLFPEYRNMIETSLVDNYIDDQRLFLMSVMRRIEYLEDEEIVPDEMLVKLSVCFEQVVFEKGQEIFTTGCKADMMYIIAEGFVEITTIMDGSQMQIDYLTYASVINAWMMLFGSTLNVTATCKSKVICYKLPQTQFFNIVRAYDKFNNMLLFKLAQIQEGAENLINLDYVQGRTVL
jgi:hypothetical protein